MHFLIFGAAIDFPIKLINLNITSRYVPFSISICFLSFVLAMSSFSCFCPDLNSEGDGGDDVTFSSIAPSR